MIEKATKVISKLVNTAPLAQAASDKCLKTLGCGKWTMAVRIVPFPFLGSESVFFCLFFNLAGFGLPLFLFASSADGTALCQLPQSYLHIFESYPRLVLLFNKLISFVISSIFSHAHVVPKELLFHTLELEWRWPDRARDLAGSFSFFSLSLALLQPMLGLSNQHSFTIQRAQPDMWKFVLKMCWTLRDSQMRSDGT